jgi:hypothetical protein
MIPSTISTANAYDYCWCVREEKPVSTKTVYMQMLSIRSSSQHHLAGLYSAAYASPQPRCWVRSRTMLRFDELVVCPELPEEVS